MNKVLVAVAGADLRGVLRAPNFSKIIKQTFVFCDILTSITKEGAYFRTKICRLRARVSDLLCLGNLYAG